MGLRQNRKTLQTQFSKFPSKLVTVDQYAVKVSIWNVAGNGELKDLQTLQQILREIEQSPLLKKTWEVWSEEGYYNSTEDIYMEFSILKK